jgi:hypothetical protein
MIYVLIININVNPGTVQRMVWPASKRTLDIPFYVPEIPTIFVSVQYPYHLANVPHFFIQKLKTLKHLQKRNSQIEPLDFNLGVICLYKKY